MAPGRTHTISTLMIGAAGMTALPISESIPFGLGCLAAVVLQPDLDQIDGEFGYYGFLVLRETWPPLEKAWNLYFTPYARLFSHRSIFSHFPFLGTFIRIVYVFWWAGFFLNRQPLGAGWFITALVACDILHWIMDWRVWTRMGFFKQKGNYG